MTYCDDPDSGQNLCYCHPDSYFDVGGVCYRAIPECGSCISSTDCGGTQTDLNNGAGSTCLPVSDAGTFCLFNYWGRCSKAFGQVLLDDGEICYPLCNACPCTPCSSYDDCPGYDVGICNLTTGVCVPPCHTKQDCSPNDVCNVVDKYLNPVDAGVFYGYGQCGPSCTNDSSCLAYELDTPSNPLVCMSDRMYPDGGSVVDDAGIPITPNRCRIDGCLNNYECIEANSDAGGTTWCDVWGGNQCVSDYCQLGSSASQWANYRYECQFGFCCMGGTGVAPQDDAGPSHGVCTAVPACQADAGSGDCCGTSAGGN
jgi:hypothetical protein